MRHLLIAAAMLVVGLAVTFGCASALEVVAVAHNNSVQGDQFEASETAKPAMQLARSSERVTSLFR